MSRWFVYVDIDYYPWGDVVEADTAEDAADKGRAGTHDYNGDWAVVVTPLSATSSFAGQARTWHLEEWGIVPRPDGPNATTGEEAQSE